MSFADTISVCNEFFKGIVDIIQVTYNNKLYSQLYP